MTLLQPITRGTSNLAAALRAQTLLNYQTAIQHVLICDASDAQSQAIVSASLAEFPTLQAELVLVTPGNEGTAEIATKIRKLQQALSPATGEVLCFVDDDVAPRLDALQVLIPHLYQPGVGAALSEPQLVSILQPVLSGDPTLSACLGNSRVAINSNTSG